MSRRLSSLARALEIAPAPEWERIEVVGIAQDSRRVRPGEIFVAIPGFVADGHDYIPDAVARGAIAVVGERRVEASVPQLVVPDSRIALAQLAAAFYGDPTRELFTVGVTGTNGKTTVCHLSAHLLGEGRTALLSTVALEERGIHAVTTPESPFIQRFARAALDSGRENLVIEASSAGLALHRTDGVDFDAAVFTNLTHDHLDFHPDWDSYLAAKLRLFQGLKPGAAAIVNRDDPAAPRFIAATQGRVLTYAIHRAADLRAIEIEYHRDRTAFTLVAQGSEVRIELRLPAEYNVYNALAAAGVGLAKGLELAEIGEALRTAPAVPGRHQTLRAVTGATVIVDFAHSPDSLARTLRFLRPRYRRVICVFGCGGASDRAKRPIMGKISGELADFTILTTDNPKDEPPARIIDEIEAGIKNTNGRYTRIVDRRDAIRRAIEISGAGDVVLLAGKGHEPYQIVGHKFVPYSDAGFLRDEGLAE